MIIIKSHLGIREVGSVIISGVTLINLGFVPHMLLLIIKFVLLICLTSYSLPLNVREILGTRLKDMNKYCPKIFSLKT